jgi:hypothetical protein
MLLLLHVPPAVEQLRVVDEPTHTFDAPVIIAAEGLTLTVTDAVLVQPLAFIAVTEYVVVLDGLALGLAQFTHDRPDVGDHTYVVAPLALNAVLPPVHIVALGLAETVGLLLTVTVTVAVLTQPAALVPVSV